MRKNMNRKTITFVTGNKKKLEEVVALLKGNTNIELVNESVDREYPSSFSRPFYTILEICLY